MYSIVKETFKSNYKGICIDEKLQYYIVEIDGAFCSLSHYTGDIDSNDDNVFDEKDECYKYLIAWATTRDKAIYLTRKHYKNKFYALAEEQYRQKILKSNKKLVVNRLLDIRDGVCYHVTTVMKRHSITTQGLKPSYDSDMRHAIDMTIDNIRYKIPNMYKGVTRENSVFLYPSLRDALTVPKKHFALCDVYAVEVDPSKIWLAPSNINEAFIFDYEASSIENKLYFDNLRRMGRLYWENSYNAQEFDYSNKSINDYEALAYDQYDSIGELKRVAMFDENGLLFPTGDFQFYIT